MENKTEEHKKEETSSYSLSLLSVGILVLFLLVVGGVYYFVSKKSKGQVVFPAGINYTGNEATPQPQKPTYDYNKLASSANWSTFTSPQGQYSFKYPGEMIPLIFPGDPNDTVTFDINNVPAQFNLMVLVDSISNYDPKMVGKQEEFVGNYWKFFGGLKSAQNFQVFETDKGLKGWKVNYVTTGGTVGTDNYFFVVPNDDNKVIHVNNIFPSEAQAVFTRILNTLEYKQ
ncbi:hypothetical protein A3F60_04855 [Candidatus Roizmanbacteria bacterium RIFCSPHIGHO2_12_FULL_39_8]|uniref:PsbP C-terminal domain-containing protein n=1 Tax=Candidatus Roizmanbacteria bacterium RIFCSPHIGHO2_12_FULL_39_8 TaxID=1802050 RepID=A0A1F7HV09_9BACT|nr:MAG: hypothetical protein A3F60_04855 [Candidatus Roizmanbacteria bacterium RIFCSPHIGHO2_12_FULL_39_8]